jgi:hypothetical protein
MQTMGIQSQKPMFKGKFSPSLDALESLFKPRTPALIGADISSSAVKMVEIAEAGKDLPRRTLCHGAVAQGLGGGRQYQQP